jgi:hypothetical protein
MAWLPLLMFVPRSTKIHWVGWGFDYYDLIHRDAANLLLPKTRKLCLRLATRKPLAVKLFKLGSRVRLLLWRFIKQRLIKRIDSVSTVIGEDYNELSNAMKPDVLPRYIPWNYGIKDLESFECSGKVRLSGCNILVGNSACPTNNHLEIIDMLASIGLADRKVFIPLSYGDPEYAKIVSDYAREKLGSRCECLMRFIPFNEYRSLLASVGFALFNHRRQQGVGNVVQMISQGARVFLHQDNPLYREFVGLGMSINTVDELLSDEMILCRTMDADERESNSRILRQRNSKEALERKTSNLLRSLTPKASSEI